jgi:hypothetical protein
LYVLLLFMSRAAEMAERHQAVLTELSALGLDLARVLHERALAAETPEETAALAGAFHRISRSVRQTLALEARLKRDLKRQDRDDLAETERQQTSLIRTRKAQVRAAVERLVWTEAEPDEAEDLLSDLDERLAEEALYPGFACDPVEAHIERLTTDLGLPDPPPGRSPIRGRRSEGPQGVAAHSHVHRPASQPPQSLQDSSPGGGASGFAEPPHQSSA